jgi:hypothetical protein
LNLFIITRSQDDKITKKRKEKQQKDEDEKIEKNLNSTLFSNTSYKTRATNNMEWGEIYKFIEDGDFTKEYTSDIDDLEDIKKVQPAQDSYQTNNPFLL